MEIRIAQNLIADLDSLVDTERINERSSQNSVHHLSDSACWSAQTIDSHKRNLLVAPEFPGGQISADRHGIVVTIDDIDLGLYPQDFSHAVLRPCLDPICDRLGDDF